MKVERERGISVSASAMTFEHDGCVFNLVDTPGHQDFSEDTYRSLTAVDSAIMVLDGAKGIEEQTRKLFEVCRLRNIPIITFINKLDRESREPFELMDEVEQALQLQVTPISWPIGSGQRFLGCYDLKRDRLALMERVKNRVGDEGEVCNGLDDPKLDQLLPETRSQDATRRGRDGARLVSAVRSGRVPRRSHDAGLLRQRHQQLRHPRAAARRGRAGSATARRKRPKNARFCRTKTK